MSRETLQAVEDALKAHMKDVAEEDYPNPVLGAWVIAWEESHITPDSMIVYSLEYASSDSSMAGVIGLASWLPGEILDCGDDD